MQECWRGGAGAGCAGGVHILAGGLAGGWLVCCRSLVAGCRCGSGSGGLGWLYKCEFTKVILTSQMVYICNRFAPRPRKVLRGSSPLPCPTHHQQGRKCVQPASPASQPAPCRCPAAHRPPPFRRLHPAPKIGGGGRRAAGQASPTRRRRLGRHGAGWLTPLAPHPPHAIDDHGRRDDDTTTSGMM